MPVSSLVQASLLFSTSRPLEKKTLHFFPKEESLCKKKVVPSKREIKMCSNHKEQTGNLFTLTSHDAEVDIGILNVCVFVCVKF